MPSALRKPQVDRLPNRPPLTVPPRRLYPGRTRHVFPHPQLIGGDDAALTAQKAAHQDGGDRPAPRPDANRHDPATRKRHRSHVMNARLYVHLSDHGPT